MTELGFAFFAGMVVTALWFAYRDRSRMVDADLVWVTEHEERMRALRPVAPVVELAPRHRAMTSIDFLLGHQPGGTSWSRTDGPTPTAGTGLAAVGDFEQSGQQPSLRRHAHADASKREENRHGPRLRTVPSTPTDGTVRLLASRDTAPLKSERRGI